MFYICTVRFNVKKNLKKFYKIFWKLNNAYSNRHPSRSDSTRTIARSPSDSHLRWAATAAVELTWSRCLSNDLLDRAHPGACAGHQGRCAHPRTLSWRWRGLCTYRVSPPSSSPLLTVGWRIAAKPVLPNSTLPLALFSFQREIFCDTVVLSFVCGNYYPIMN